VTKPNPVLVRKPQRERVQRILRHIVSYVIIQSTLLAFCLTLLHQMTADAAAADQPNAAVLFTKQAQNYSK